jgi:hypothetical protein
VPISSVLANIAIGLVTSVIGGGAVWLWQRAGSVRALRRKERFFGIEPGGTCLIVMNNKYNMPGSTHHNDVHAMIEIATLASSIGSAVLIESCNDFQGVNGNRTEFCIGGPASNPRTAAHVAAHLPGITLRPFDRDLDESAAILVGDEQFRFIRNDQEYTLIAKFTPPAASRPVILICGQSSIANRAAVNYLKREYLNLSRSLSSTGKFCVVVRAVSTDAYGHQAAELAGDFSATAFRSFELPPAPAENAVQAGPGS